MLKMMLNEAGREKLLLKRRYARGIRSTKDLDNRTCAPSVNPISRVLH